MTEPIKIRTQIQGNVTEIKILLPHPMETGSRKDAKTDQLIPAYFIQHITITINGVIVINVESSQAISRDPVFSFQVKGIKIGDRLMVNWVDNKGQRNEAIDRIS